MFLLILAIKKTLDTPVLSQALKREREREAPVRDSDVVENYGLVVMLHFRCISLKLVAGLLPSLVSPLSFSSLY